MVTFTQVTMFFTSASDAHYSVALLVKLYALSDCTLSDVCYFNLGNICCTVLYWSTSSDFVVMFN